MNEAQQLELVANQRERLQDCNEWRLIPSDEPLELRLDMLARSNRRFNILLDLSGYDVLPPRLYILDKHEEVTWSLDDVPGHPFLNASVHPRTGRIFFCVKGTYDYHTHPLHEHQTWDALRNSWPLPRIVAEISTALRKEPVVLARPDVKLSVSIPPTPKKLQRVELLFPRGEFPPQATYVFKDGTTMTARGG